MKLHVVPVQTRALSQLTTISDHGVKMMSNRSVRPALRRYGLAVLASALALVFAWLIRPWIEPNVYFLLLAAVVVSAWYAGFGPRRLATLIGAILSYSFFLPPTSSLDAIRVSTLVQWSVFVLVALLIRSLPAVRKRAVVFMNPVAEPLTGSKQKAAIGKVLEDVFRVVDEQTRVPVENLVTRVLRATRSPTRKTVPCSSPKTVLRNRLKIALLQSKPVRGRRAV